MSFPPPGATHREKRETRKQSEREGMTSLTTPTTAFIPQNVTDDVLNLVSRKRLDLRHRRQEGGPDGEIEREVLQDPPKEFDPHLANLFPPDQPLRHHHQRQQEQHHHHHSLPVSLLSDRLTFQPWSSTAIASSSTLLTVLQSWEGRDAILIRRTLRSLRQKKTRFQPPLFHFQQQLCHSTLLLIHSSLHFREPRSRWEVFLSPAGYMLTRSFSRSTRSTTLRRISSSCEALANLRSFCLLTRWVELTALGLYQSVHRIREEEEEEKEGGEGILARIEIETENELDETVTDPDVLNDGFTWLQPRSVVPLDYEPSTNEITGTPCVQDVQLADVGGGGGGGGSMLREEGGRSTSISKRLERWEDWLTKLNEGLSTVGEALEMAHFTSASLIWWYGLRKSSSSSPYASSPWASTLFRLIPRRRWRRRMEVYSLYFTLASVLATLLLVRVQNRRLRARSRSAHRLILQTSDSLGWRGSETGILSRLIPTSRVLSQSRLEQDPTTNLSEPEEKRDEEEDGRMRLQELKLLSYETSLKRSRRKEKYNRLLGLGMIMEGFNLFLEICSSSSSSTHPRRQTIQASTAILSSLSRLVGVWSF
ncbi:hypothetical protein IE53DRAFT_42799 [Violaceomyces palustris]|uniref:Uncharacterized protein n=1 Tax=Violaceomyces palustris TaxID=1673888 RepID=A0ACD0P0H2_9BASI|nr:hypothetical protein IE53DRAFT_42799 [Violaceomyces palustris]